MSSAKIAIVLNGGKIMIRSQIKDLPPAELALLITHIDMLSSELKEQIKKIIKRHEEKKWKTQIQNP